MNTPLIILGFTLLVVVAVFSVWMAQPELAPEQIEAKARVKLEKEEAEHRRQLERERQRAEIEALKPESVRVEEIKKEAVQGTVLGAGELLLWGTVLYNLTK